MRVLYLRNVPDEVVDRLERLARKDSISLNAVAIRELTEVSKRVDNAALLGDLPDLKAEMSSIVRDVEEGRSLR